MLIPIKNYSYYGLDVSDVTERSVRDYFQWVISTFQNKIIYGYSLYSIYALRKMPEIYTLGSQADLFLTDGRPFFWLCKLAGIPITDGLSIPECVIQALNFADVNKLRVMLIGATRETNENAYEILKIKYKQTIFLEGHHGFFSIHEENNIIEKINKSKPDILLVGMSSPKKEKFVFNNKTLLNAKIIIPCGGMIDVLAGKTRMTPRWLKRMGLASVYRVVQEPRRLLFDRIKMVWFLFSSFFPLILVHRIFGKEDLSIPAYYLNINSRQEKT